MMACNCVNSRCNRCRNFVATTAVTVSGTNLVLQIPSNNYSNDSEVCICVAQPLPTGVTPKLTVVVQIGTAATLYSLRTKCGHNVYGDQIRTRTLYCTRVAADSATFVFNGRCALPCTDAVIPGSLPITQVTNTSTTAAVASVNGGNTK